MEFPILHRKVDFEALELCTLGAEDFFIVPLLWTRAGFLRLLLCGSTYPRGAQPTQIAHQKQQLLTASEEKAIIQICFSLDTLRHPLELSYVKSLLLPPSQRRGGGKHWISRFLERNSEATGI